MKLSHILGTIVIAAVTTFGVVHTMGSSKTDKPVDVIYEDVKKSGVLHCGYLVWAPFIAKDPNSGVVSGVMYDLMERIGQKLSLKIEWSVEMGMSDIGPNVQSRRIDAFCNVAGIVGARAREMDYTIPYGYLGIYAVGRAGDPVYADVKSVADLNNPKFRLVTLDGEISSILGRSLFPDAEKIALQQLSSTADLMNNVATNKADFGLFDKGPFNDYNANNPGKLEMLPLPPVGTLALALPVSPDAPKLRQMLNGALVEILNNGEMAAILKKHNVGPDMFMLPATPFEK